MNIRYPIYEGVYRILTLESSFIPISFSYSSIFGKHFHILRRIRIFGVKETKR